MGCYINTMEKDIELCSILYKHNKEKHLILCSQILILQNHSLGNETRVFGSRWIYGPLEREVGRSSTVRCHLRKVWINDWLPYCLWKQAHCGRHEISLVPPCPGSTQRPTHPRGGQEWQNREMIPPKSALIKQFTLNLKIIYTHVRQCNKIYTAIQRW